jgi:hypothetical protein
MDGRLRTAARRGMLVALAAALLSLGGVASASAASPIEGVWAFNGGEIAVQPQSSETFAGTVVTETKFAECTHPIGQQIWTGIAAQPDGSFWGLHQWYFEKTACTPNPEAGLAAFRVVEEANGAHYLRVCLSYPGGTQPTISATGVSAKATYGCVSSALTAPLPTTLGRVGTASFKELVRLPSAKKCFSQRAFKIHIQDPKFDAFKTVSITIGKRRIKAVRQGSAFVASISLKGLPTGKFTVRIRATTYLGQHLSGSRTYHTCARKPSRHKASTKLR